MLGRTLVTDAAWGIKSKQNRDNDIRKCVSCNNCWGVINLDQPLQCDNNPRVGFENEIYVFVVHVPFAFSGPRLSSPGSTRKTAPRASHSVTPKQKKPVQRSFHHLEFIHTCTKKHIWRNHVRVLSGGMRTAPLSEFTFFLCYLWDRKKCKLISDERCQGLDTNSFHFILSAIRVCFIISANPDFIS